MSPALVGLLVLLGGWSTASAQCAGGGTPTGLSCGVTGATYQGCCDGISTLTWCENGVHCVKDCAANPSNNCCEWSAKPGCCNAQVMAQVCGVKPECCTDNWGGGCLAVLVTFWDTYDCQTSIPSCDATYNLCGWDPAKQFYNCSPQHTADPSGTYPLECSGCTPNCTGKVCGTDGCGGSCGTCAATAICNGLGQCVPNCTPQCNGKNCGDDGCGGVCGSCGADQECASWGECISCEPSCFDRECGDDGCGGSCGTCTAPQNCNAFGKCDDAPCEPQCTGKTCGDNGCGGVCGSCDSWESCVDGQCKLTSACEPECIGKTCGDDGCGGTCGTCDPWESCDAGQCKPSEVCEQQCINRECGDDGCGGSCGTCNTGEVCNSAGSCVTPGVPVTPILDSGDSGDGASSCQAGDAPTSALPGWIFLVLGLLALVNGRCIRG